MGGAVTLLLVATMGITFGWTPDGADGVKYIIQVPPDQLDQLERVGEITSTISPEVRGRVSEIVIRVGDGPVPRQMPANWMQTNASHPSGVSQVVSDENALRGLPIASDDRRPIPIPMSSNSMQPGIIPGNVNSPSVTRLMKPQSNGMSMPGGFDAPAPTGAAPTGGFSMPPSLAQGPTATGAANNGSLGDSLRAGAESFGRSIGLGTPSTAPTNAAAPNRDPSTTVAPPPFTGTGNSNLSGNPNLNNTDRAARAGGPSTDPAASTGSSARPWPNNDDDWYALGDRPAQRPSTAPVNNSATASNAGTTSRPGSDATNRNATNTGLNTGNFNQMPSGISGQNPYGQSNSDTLANSSSRRETPYSTTAADRDDTIRRDEYAPHLTAAEAARLPKNGYDFDDAGNAVDRFGYRLNAYGDRIDQNGRPMDASSYADNRANANTDPTGNPQYSSNNPFPGGASPTTQPGRNSTDATYANQSGSGYGQSNTGSPAPGYPASGNGSSAYPANQNTASGAAANPYGPNGQTYPTANTQQPPPTIPTGYAGSPRNGYPNAAQPQTQYPQVPNYGTTPPYAPIDPNINPATGYPYQNANYPNTVPTYVANSNTSAGGSPTGSPSAGAAPPRGRGSGSTDAAGATTGATSDNGDRSNREKVATQTLFNALLLVSFVANLYLMYWLNVLRLKYQEMVAAKRAAASSNAAAVA